MRSIFVSLLLLLAVGTVMTRAAFADPKPIVIAIAGDSTVADYKADDPHRGWGQLFPEFVDTAHVTVKNFAKNGRSTKTFLSEGLWDKTLTAKPDYVYIQFGHNDSHSKSHPEATDADTDYSQYLRQYVETARAQGAKPILVTPMHRGSWDVSGIHLTSELQPYADAMKRVAAEKKVPVIDLYTLSGAAFEKIGRDQLDTIFAIPTKDHTHFNEKGARLLAGIVATETAHVVPALRPYLKLPVL